MSVKRPSKKPALEASPITDSDLLKPTISSNPGNRYVAYCGIDCSQCPQYQNSCPDGCLGITCVDYCGQCEVRKCSMERQSVNCGYCEMYPCQKLENQYTNMEMGGYGEWAVAAKVILEGIRSGNKIIT